MTKLEVLERRHGSVFVSHTLAAITAARSGLTEPEILDILSVDTEVKRVVLVKPLLTVLITNRC